MLLCTVAKSHAAVEHRFWLVYACTQAVLAAVYYRKELTADVLLQRYV